MERWLTLSSKSRLAVEIAHKLYGNAFDSIFWFDASSSTTFMEDIKVLARRLHLPVGKDSKITAEAVKTWLEDNDNGSWLMILDGASAGAVSDKINIGLDAKERSLVRFLPQRSTSPLRTILMTTFEVMIAQQWSTPGSMFEMRPLDSRTAIELLTQASEAKASEEQAIAVLTEELDRIPSAIHSASAVIRSRRVVGFTVNAYLKELRHCKNTVEQLDGTTYSVRSLYSTSRSVTASWWIAINAVEAQSRHAIDLLCLIACLDGTKLSVELFQLAFKWDEKDLQERLLILLNFRLISPDDRNKTFTMPRLVRKTIRVWMQEQTQESGELQLLHIWHLRALKTLLDAYNAMQSRNDKDDLKLQKERVALLPHMEIFRKFCRREANPLPLQEEHVRAIVDFAALFSGEGFYVSAEHILYFATRCSIPDAWQKTVRIRLAGCLRDQSMVDGDINRLKKALDMVRRVQAMPGEVDHIELWGMLAILHTDRGNYKDAAHFQRNIWCKRKEQAGRESSVALEAELDLSVIHWRAGQHRAALEEQLRIERCLCAKGQPSGRYPELQLLQVQAAIVRTRYTLDEMHEAKQLAERVVAGRSRLLGEFDLLTIASQKDLVQCLRALDQEERAKQTLNGLKLKLQQKFGVQHAEVQGILERVDSMRASSLV